MKIINELIDLSDSKKKEPTIFLWPEGIIPDSHLDDMKVYTDLFLENFGDDDLIIMGLNNVEKKNDKSLFFNSVPKLVSVIILRLIALNFVRLYNILLLQLLLLVLPF